MSREFSVIEVPGTNYGMDGKFMPSGLYTIASINSNGVRRYLFIEDGPKHVQEVRSVFHSTTFKSFDEAEKKLSEIRNSYTFSKLDPEWN